MNTIDCTDIYMEEIDKRIKTLKRFREAWLQSSATWNEELFQYADSDFYFYRFAIERQEKGTEQLLTQILLRMMKRYTVKYEPPDDAPFDFILCENDERIGCRFFDFYQEEDVNNILDYYDLDKAYIIRLWKTGKPDKWIADENKYYQTDNVRLRAISIKDFFEYLFSKDEYCSFLRAIEQYLEEARSITGYQSIKFLSSMNLASQKLFEEKILVDWDYEAYRYQIIDTNNKEIKKFLYLSNYIFSEEDFKEMRTAYIEKRLYRTMIGTNEYAESFITSEWLYHSLKGKTNFDYTSVISGYLKSIEQLLFQIVMINLNNNCKISMKSKLLKKAYNNKIAVYKYDGNWEPLPDNKWGNGYEFTQHPYIDFLPTQKKYMDSSIGTFEHFIRKNPHIFTNPQNADKVADMVSCFRTECRNGFFHTHNLNDWNVVEKTRNNAIYLYFVLLGSCIIPKQKETELGLLPEDRFDALCMKIREFRHYSTNFIFEYHDGKRVKLSYDSYTNTIEFSDEGVEHYEKLLFHKVDEFSMEEYEKLAEPEVRAGREVYLTRVNLPSRIFGVHRNHDLEEITF